MKKIFTLLTMALLAIGAQAQTITFTEVKAAGTLDGVTFGTGLVLTVTDKVDGGKVSIDANQQYFGTLDSPQKYEFRLKTGGKSDSKNALKLTTPSAGKLTIAMRSSSSSATRTVKFVGQTELASFSVTDDNKTKGHIEGEEEDKNVFTYYTIESVPAGDINITYDGGTNFYAFIFESGGSDTPDTPADPHEATVWDFTKTTAELLNPAYWTEDANTSGRYTYGTEIASDTYKDLGELGCSEGLGLLVGRSGNKLAANSIRVDVGKQIQINASNGVYKITDLAKDDVVRLRYKSASDEARKFTVTNGDVTELDAPANSAENAEQEATITVAADGDLLLTQSKAINVYVITVNAELPEATGIRTINVETVSNGAIYNLNGQRVDENYRGVVIKNGKKQMQK